VIVVKIELHPASGGPKQLLGSMIIANDGTGALNKGNYNVAVMRKDALRRATRADPEKGVARTGRVENYPRTAYNVWRLVCRAVRAAFPEER
jgi:hypothetical protein